MDRIGEQAGLTSRLLVSAGWSCVAALPILYGSRVIFDLPLLDDWSFVHALQQYLAGDMSLCGYLFARHNEHLALPSRAAFLLLYHVTALDLRVLRWLTIATWMASAAITAFVLRRDVARMPTASVHRLAWILPAAMMATSLAAWETISLAMAFTNAFALVTTLCAVLAFERWRQQERRLAFVVCCLLGSLASVSLASGLLLWFVFAAAATCTFRLARRQVETAILWALGLLLLWAQATVPATGGGDGDLEPARLALGVVLVAGTPLSWPGSELGTLARSVAGAAAIAGFAAALVRELRARSAANDHRATYVLWGAIGILTCAAVSWARHRSAGLEGFPASRHVPMVLPLLLGSYGYWVSAAGAGGAARRVALAAAVSIAGLTCCVDVVEYRMWRGRADAYRLMLDSLRTEDLAQLPADTWRTRFLLEPWLARQVAHEIVPFLRRERLSFCR